MKHSEIVNQVFLNSRLAENIVASVEQTIVANRTKLTIVTTVTVVFYRLSSVYRHISTGFYTVI